MTYSYKVGFVVLHYNALKSTIMTVNSIKNSVKNGYIVIVDNNSPNKTGKDLIDLYKNDIQVKVLLLDQNLGFSKGNNEGYKWIKSHKECKYICIVNNDVIFLDSDLEARLDNAYNKFGFGVLGPNIVLADGSANIFNPKIRSKEKIEYDINQFEKELARLDKRSYLGQIIRDMLYPIRKRAGIIKNENAGKEYKEITNVLLHGCCLFLSPLYIEKFANAFFEATFMYCEEELLYLRCMRNNIKTLYFDDIHVKHLEKVSTNTQFYDNRKRRIVQLRNLIYSHNKLLFYLNDKENNLI